MHWMMFTLTHSRCSFDCTTVMDAGTCAARGCVSIGSSSTASFFCYQNNTGFSSRVYVCARHVRSAGMQLLSEQCDVPDQPSMHILQLLRQRRLGRVLQQNRHW